MDTRFDDMAARFDDLGMHVSGMGRTIAIGAVSIAVTLLVFLSATMITLVTSGALG